MRVLVYPHDLSVGGSQLNAIEIAARIAKSGHDTVVYGRPGPLVERIRDLGLEFLPAPDVRRRPSRVGVAALANIVDSRRIDVIHGYEWPPALESFLVSRSRPHTASVATVMSMAVAPFIPHTMPLVVGTAQIAADGRQVGRTRVTTLEPPIDLEENAPPGIGVAEFAARHGLDRQGLLIVMVTRLAREMKLEGILSAIDAVSRLSPASRATLVIVGDGPARDEVAESVRQVNSAAGRALAVMTGEMFDPRPAYAAADIVLGMGGSALKAMAFGKPLIVQGEQGFWRLADERTFDQFLWTGWYGVGDGRHTGAGTLMAQIAPLLDDPALRERLGAQGRALVEGRFSLAAAAERQMAVYRAALDMTNSPLLQTTDILQAATRFIGYKVNRKLRRITGRARTDDFNSRPVVARRVNRSS